ncbi:MAG: DUF3285 domain-containing protein [Synechococcales cyanobacterium C42_A2020_086]|jgi:hypothetical protein|nr:DUF3285 domain-containing protein [Synechococcales cyanobacterium M58_A2018_015]MBF2076069.1 DUF3285 domain-containing protein [Synechococcales cyanobacterium C42_A2020_086]
MSQSSQTPNQPKSIDAAEPTVNGSVNGSSTAVQAPVQPQPSYIKLAMRNMVRKRGTSLYHFALTTIGLLAVLIGLAYLTR